MILRSYDETIEAIKAVDRSKLTAVSLSIAQTSRARGVVYIFGNGGSAAESAHMASELSGGMYRGSPIVLAVDLSAMSATMTAISNDFAYSSYPSLVLHAASKLDTLILLSTSGTSKNVRMAADVAKSNCIETFMITGDHVDAPERPFPGTRIIVPSRDTQVVQEVTLLLIHDICYEVDRLLSEGMK